MGNGALAIASWTGQLEIAKRLVELGLEVNGRHEVLDAALAKFCL